MIKGILIAVGVVFAVFCVVALICACRINHGLD